MKKQQPLFFAVILSLIFILIMMGIGMQAAAQNDSLKQRNELSKIALPFTNPNWINMRAEVAIKASALVTEYKPALGLGINDELKLSRQETDELDFTRYRYRQHYKGYKIISGEFTVHEQGGRTNSANGILIKGMAQNPVINLSRQQALESAKRLYGANAYAWEVPKLEKERKEIFRNTSTTYFPEAELV